MLELMDVVETVTRTGKARLVDHLMADGIVRNAMLGGYVVDRQWKFGIFMVKIFRPGASLPMLTYSVRTD